MANDKGEPDRPDPAPSFELPEIRSVSFRRVPFRPPARRNFASALPVVEEAVEFLVETDAPFPVRALGPTLYVGEVAVTEVVADDPTHYRFVALAPEALRDGSGISVGWTGSAAARVDSGFTYG